MFNKFLNNLLSWKTQRKLLVVESDDWGSLRNYGAPISHDSKYGSQTDVYLNYDHLEGLADLTELKEVLKGYVDKNGRNPVITANVAVANPDFESISNSNWQEYYYETVDTTFQRLGEGQAWDYWLNTIQEGFIYPQFHCREHLNINDFTRFLHQGFDEGIKELFLDNKFGFFIDDHVSRKGNFQVAWDYSDEKGLSTIKSNIIDGLDIFQKIYGFKSITAIAPSYTWNSLIEKVLYDAGVRGIQGVAKRQNPDGGTHSFIANLRFMGNKGRSGLTNLVRNAFFEPSHAVEFNAKSCLRRIDYAFNLNFPAIVGAHRVNFMGGLVEENRTNNLQQLKWLFSELTSKYKNIEFITSAELVKIINEER